MYIEGCLNSGAIMKRKRPADTNIGIDIDPEIIHRWEIDEPEYSCSLINDDLVNFIANWRDHWDRSTRVFLYIDLPYLFSTRKSKDKIYRFEFGEPKQHALVLAAIQDLPWMVAISHYQCKQYDQALKGWRRIEWTAITRGGGTAVESLYMNYPEPFELHDYSYLGNDYRERERIAKKKRRWDRNLAKMPALERYAILSVIEKHRTGGMS